MRIAFTHNLKTADVEAQAEFDTPETVAHLAGLMRSLGHEVHPIDVSGPVSRLVARLEVLRPDLVFNTAEGTHGRFREAFYPALFEQLRLPFTGSDAHACAVTLDKHDTKMRVRRVGVSTPRWQFYDRDRRPDARLADLRLPVIVKPAFEGSSIGITADSIVYDGAALMDRVTAAVRRFPAGVLVEEFIVGRDVTVPWLEKTGVLSAAEYDFGRVDARAGHAIYDYALKNEESDRVSLRVPAHLDADVATRIGAATTTVIDCLAIRDLGRVDFRVTDDGELFFIEVNALPSLESGASLFEAARLRGLSEVEVVAAVIESAVTRQSIAPQPARSTAALRVGLAHNVRRIDPRSGDDADAEFDGPETIEAIAEAIEGLGHSVVLLEATPELPRLLGDVDVDLVFNIAEGMRGRSREAQVPALLELMGIPYTGSDPAALAVTLDKGLAKRLVHGAGLATPKWWVVPPGQAAPQIDTFPVIVKPNGEGTSKGISAASVARDAAALQAAVTALHQRYGAEALIEGFLPGREFTVGLVGEVDPLVLPIMEICFDAPVDDLPVYGYEHKAAGAGGVRFQVPAALEPALAERIVALARGCFAALGCRDVARIDVRLDADGEPAFIECNPLPGLSPGFSDLCVIAETAGLDHAALIGAILAPAVRRARKETT